MTQPNGGGSAGNGNNVPEGRWTRWGALAGIAGVIVAIVGIFVAQPPSPPPQPSSSPAPSQTTTVVPEPSPIPTTNPPSLSPTSSPAVQPAPPPAEAMKYLADQLKECGMNPGFANYGAVTINGKPFAHSLKQGMLNPAYFDLSGNPKRFQATVGIPSGEPQGMSVQLEVLAVDSGGGERSLYTSPAITQGKIDTVDVSVSGVVRLGLRATKLSGGYGYVAWGDAEVTSEEPMTC